MTEKHDTDSLAVNSEQSDQSTEDVKTESKTDSWQNHISRIWHDTSKRLIKLFPVDQAVPIIMQWFTVDEAKVAEILVKVRAELPTTEAILIGKPQTGKSSIVRGRFNRSFSRNSRSRFSPPHSTHGTLCLSF